MSGRAHAVCAREAGLATLEALARTLADGDTLILLGPASAGEVLVGYGLRRGVRLVCVGSVGGGFRPVAHLVRQAIAGSASVRCHGPEAFAIVAGAGCHAVRGDGLSVESARVAPWTAERRARLRAELGLRGATRGVLLSGDPSESLDARFAARVCAMARFAGTRLRVIASPRVAGIGKVEQWLDTLGIGDTLATHPLADEPWRVLGALDAAFVDGDGGPARDSDALVDRALLPIGPLSSEWRARAPGWQPSPLVAAWAVAAGVPTFVHESLDVDGFAGPGRLLRFGDDVSRCAEMICETLAPAGPHAPHAAAGA